MEGGIAQYDQNRIRGAALSSAKCLLRQRTSRRATSQEQAHERSTGVVPACRGTRAVENGTWPEHIF